MFAPFFLSLPIVCSDTSTVRYANSGAKRNNPWERKGERKEKPGGQEGHTLFIPLAGRQS